MTAKPPIQFWMSSAWAKAPSQIAAYMGLRIRA